MFSVDDTIAVPPQPLFAVKRMLRQETTDYTATKVKTSLSSYRRCFVVALSSLKFVDKQYDTV